MRPQDADGYEAFQAHLPENRVSLLTAAVNRLTLPQLGLDYLSSCVAHTDTAITSFVLVEAHHLDFFDRRVGFL